MRQVLLQMYRDAERGDLKVQGIKIDQLPRKLEPLLMFGCEVRRGFVPLWLREAGRVLMDAADAQVQAMAAGYGAWDTYMKWVG